MPSNTQYKYSVSEAAKYLSVTSWTLRNWEKSGKLIPHRTKGNQRSYTLSQLNEFLATQTNAYKREAKLPTPSPLIFTPLPSKFDWKVPFLGALIGCATLGAAIGLFLHTLQMKQPMISFSMPVPQPKSQINPPQAQQSPGLTYYPSAYDQIVPSLNLVPNSSFEANNDHQPPHWYYTGQSTSDNTFVSQDTSHSGQNSLKFLPGSSDLGVLNVDTVSGAARGYKLSFYIKTYKNTAFDVAVSWWDTKNKVRVNTQNRLIDESNLSDQSAGWQFETFDLPSPGPDQGKDWFPLIEIPNLTSGVAYIDDVSVTEVGTNGMAQVRPTGNYIDAIGDGSILITAGGEMVPSTNKTGTLGTINLAFQSLYLQNASIDSDGNASFAGGITTGGDSSIGGNLSVSGSITSGGSLTSGEGISIAGDLIPSQDASFSLGSSSSRWANLFLSGNAGIGGSLNVTSGANFASSVNVSGNTNLNTLGVSGSTTLSGLSSFAGTALCINSSNQVVTCSGSSSLTGSGVNGGVAYWNGTNSLTNSAANFFFDSTNKRLGIGNSAPSQSLDIQTSGNNSSVRVTSNNTTTGGLYLYSGNPQSAAISGAAELVNGNWTSRTNVGAGSGFASMIYVTDNGNIEFYTNTGLTNGNTFTPAERLRITTTGNVGIGLTTANSQLSVSNNVHIGSLFQGTAAPTNGLFVDGNVGIGATTSSNKLDVWGNARITGNLTVDGTLTGPASGSVGYWSRTPGLLFPTTITDTIATYGNVGIGTTAPGAQLELLGGSGTGGLKITGSIAGNYSASSIQIDDSAGIARFFSAGANTGTKGGYNFNQATSNGGSNTTAMVIDANGNVGIGNTSPNGQLVVRSSNRALALQANTANQGVDLQFFDSSNVTNYKWDLSYRSGTTGTNDPLFLYNSSSTVTTAFTQTGNLGIGTTAPSQRFQVNDGSSASVITSTGNIGIGTTSPNGPLHVVSQNTTGSTTSSSVVIENQKLTTGTGLYMASQTLTSGRMADISLTSSNLTGTAGIGSILNIDWSPSIATTATGDLFALNIGANGTTTGNLFDILNNSSSIFSISQTALTTSLPASFTAPGDVSIAYDINFTNPTASYIKSLAPLYLVAGDINNSSNLTLQTYNSGIIDLDTGSGGSIMFTQGGTQRLMLDTNGNLGIGSFAPSSMLAVGGNVGIGVSYGAASIVTPTNGLAVQGNVGIGATTANSNLFVNGGVAIGSNFNKVAPTNGLIVQGNVGIGFSSPAGLLQVGSTAGNGNNPALLVTANGNVGIGTSAVGQPLTVGTAGTNGNGAFLSVGGVWTNGSSIAFKENFSALNASDILAKVNSLPILEWNYINEDPGIKHIGPLAEDFYSLFNVGNDAQHISTIDPAGIALLSIQALSAKESSSSSKLDDLAKRVAKLEASASGQATGNRQQNATDSATTSDCSLTPTACSLNLTPPDTLLATGSATLVNLNVTSDATVSGMLTAYGAQIQDHFKVLGLTTLAKTNVAGDLTIDGTTSLSGTSLTSIPTLYLQNSPIAEKVDIFNGLVTIDKYGNLAVQKLTVSENTLGSSILLKNTQQVTITSAEINSNSHIFLTPQEPAVLGVTKNAISHTFTVKILNSLDHDLKFDFWIVDSKPGDI